MHEPESVVENETLKIHWDFELQSDHIILARWPDLDIIWNKKYNFVKSRLCCPGRPQREHF